VAKIYVASSWRNEYQQEIVAMLREAGHEVYDFRNPAPGNTGFMWSAIDPEWKKWTPERFRDGLAHQVAQEGFGFDFRAMEWADQCVLVLPTGRSAHLEAGWFMGQGKPVTILAVEPIEPELMYLLAGSHNAITTTTSEMLTRVLCQEINAEVCFGDTMQGVEYSMAETFAQEISQPEMDRRFIAACEQVDPFNRNR